MMSSMSGSASASASAAADEFSDVYDTTTTTTKTMASSSSVPPLPPISVAATANSTASPTPTATTATTVRYSGRAHIRGKIRRVWRPRYLELCDNGLVRYFELPSSPSSSSSSAAVVATMLGGGDFSMSSSVGGGDFGASADGGADGMDGIDIDMEQRTQDLKHFNMILKDTLVVYHARIIDVTTLRDIHVGLPKGCYGFLFKGQRSSFFGLTINNNNNNAVVDVLPSPSSLSSQQNDLLYHSNNQTPSPPRDYFCAVGSLEEAQAWVVALQWAADICKRNNYYLLQQRQLSSSSSASFDHQGNNRDQNQNRNKKASSSSSSPYSIYHDDDDDDVDDDFVMTHDNNNSTAASASTSASAVTNSNKRTGTGMMISNCGMSSSRPSTSKPAAAATTRTSPSSSTSSTLHQKPINSGSKASRVLVTKTYGYQIVKIKSSSTSSLASSSLSSSFRWDIAYQVALLVVTTRTSPRQHTSSSSSSASSNFAHHNTTNTATTATASKRHVSVEERRILLTAEDVQDLVHELSNKDVKSRILQPFVRQLKQQADSLPTWNDGDTSTKQNDLKRSVYRTTKSSTYDEEHVHKVALDAVGTIDGILRALSMESSAVNSSSMKKAFGLNVESPDILKIVVVDDGDGDNNDKGTTSKNSSSSSSRKNRTEKGVTTSPWMRLFKAMIGDTSSPAYITLVHNNNSNTTSTPTTIHRQVKQLPEDVIVDDFVREWLSQIHSQATRKIKLDRRRRQKEAQRWQYTARLWMEERPWLVVGGVGVAAAALYPASQMYSKYAFSTNVRADVLAASWCVAFWLGKKHQEKQFQQKIKKSTQVVKKTKRQYQQQQQQHRRPDIASTAHALSPSSRSQTLSPSQQTLDSYDMIQSQQSDRSLTYSTQNPTFSFPSNSISVSDSFDDERQDGNVSDDDSALDGDESNYLESDNVEDGMVNNTGKLSSPLPKHPDNDGSTCWSEHPDPSIFKVRGSSYFEDRIKVPSGRSPFKCRGVDVWMTDNPERHIARHPSVLGGKLKEEDTFLVNFLLPFGNFVAYFSVPPLEEFPNPEVAEVWSKFIQGDQQYRDARLKLLPVVMDGPWIVKAAVGNGTSPALLGKVIPLQYFFEHPSPPSTSSDGSSSTQSKDMKKGTYEVDVIITASSIAKGILSVVKSHTKSLTIAFALIIEAAKQEELPETVLCHFQIHSVDLDDCPMLPPCNLEDV